MSYPKNPNPSFLKLLAKQVGIGPIYACSNFKVESDRVSTKRDYYDEKAGEPYVSESEIYAWSRRNQTDACKKIMQINETVSDPKVRVVEKCKAHLKQAVYATVGGFYHPPNMVPITELFDSQSKCKPFQDTVSDSMASLGLVLTTSEIQSRYIPDSRFNSEGPGECQVYVGNLNAPSKMPMLMRTDQFTTYLPL